MKQRDAVGDDLRLAFHLKFHHKLSNDFVKIDTSKMIEYTFIDSDFSQLETILLHDKTI